MIGFSRSSHECAIAEKFFFTGEAELTAFCHDHIHSTTRVGFAV